MDGLQKHKFLYLLFDGAFQFWRQYWTRIRVFLILTLPLDPLFFGMFVMNFVNYGWVLCLINRLLLDCEVLPEFKQLLVGHLRHRPGIRFVSAVIQVVQRVIGDLLNVYLTASNGQIQVIILVYIPVVDGLILGHLLPAGVLTEHH